jgi:hypothetical protein
MIFRRHPGVTLEQQHTFHESDESEQWAAYVKDWIYTRRPERVTRDDIQVAALWSCKDFSDFYWKFQVVLDHLVDAGHLKENQMER